MKYFISQLFKNPAYVRYAIKRKLISPQSYSLDSASSISDGNHYYLEAVIKATNNRQAFRKFKKDPAYNDILEHASYEEALESLEIIENQTPQLLENINDFRINDAVGGARCEEFNDLGMISPSTIRYLKIASDIISLFQNTVGENIVEIGTGYGGQYLILDRAINFSNYTLMDLNEVLELNVKYLENFVLNSSYTCSTLNQLSSEHHFDLVISNFAFSELSRDLQIKYVDKVLSRSKRGYLLMNSGNDDSVFTKGSPRWKEKPLHIKELEEMLPKFRQIDENPLTFPGNYVIVWGDNE
ncbi:MAG: putative sugar O-methyltransferase [Gammaproteobacteria bacterium]